MPDDKERGLYDKYHVTRLDGKPVGACIILEFKDPLARIGIAAWAKAVRDAGYVELAENVTAMLIEVIAEHNSAVLERRSGG